MFMLFCRSKYNFYFSYILLEERLDNMKLICGKDLIDKMKLLCLNLPENQKDIIQSY